MATRLQIAQKDILRLFESLDQNIFGPRELASILSENRCGPFYVRRLRLRGGAGRTGLAPPICTRVG